MAHGNFANGDYFIDCPDISQSALRAIFGVWINVCVAVIALCLRYIYRSHIKRAILSHKRPQSVWYVSPAVTPTEVIELRALLIRALGKGRFGFVIASVFCVVAAAVGAASTVISNRAVVMNTIERDTLVQGVLVTREHTSINGAIVAITSRIDALDKAGAPLTELLDFTPNDDENWIYEPSQWNNSWKANCKFDIKKDAELHLYPSNSSTYQNEVPSLGNYIPSWAAEHENRQGVTYSGFYEGSVKNGTGVWRDMVVTYVFGSWPGSDELDFNNIPSTANVSLVNFLAHRVGRVSKAIHFEETRIKSDVHIADCAFSNTVEGGKAVEDQAMTPAEQPGDAATNIAGIYQRSVVESSIRERPVKQPTGQEMLRYFQAYKSVKDSQYPHPKARVLLARREMVQIRLSTLATSVGTFLLALIAVTISRIKNISSGAHKVHLPSSQLDWTVLAVKEYARQNPALFLSQHTTRDQTSPATFARGTEDRDNIGIGFVRGEGPELRFEPILPDDFLEPQAQVAAISPIPSPTSISGQKEGQYDPWAEYYQNATPVNYR